MYEEREVIVPDHPLGPQPDAVPRPPPSHITDTLVDYPSGDTSLRRLLRIYAVACDIARTIAHLSEPQEVFEAACDLAVRLGGLRSAWISLIDAQSRRMTHMAHAGQAEGYLEKLDITAPYSQGEPDAILEAIRSGERVVVSDIAHDPRTAHWQAEALGLDCCAFAAFPLRIDSEVCGALHLYAAEPEYFAEDVLPALESVAAGIGLALELHEQRQRRAQTSAALSDDGHLLTETCRIAKIGGWEFDPATGEGTWTAEVTRIHDLDPAAPMDVQLGLSVFRGENRAKSETAIREAVEAGKPYNLELQMVTAKGSRKWVRALGQPVVVNGEVVRVRGTIQDITEHKHAEEQILQLKRLYATLSQINQAIAQIKSSDELFAAICEAVARYGEFGLVWIGLLDGAAGEIVPVEARGLALEQLPFKRITIRETGLIGRAVSSSEVATSEDIQSDPTMAHWQKFAALRPYHSVAAVPFRWRGRCLGVLSLYSEEAGFFKAEEERNLLEEISLDISFALDALETEADRERAAEALRESEARYLQMIASIDDVVWSYEVDELGHPTSSYASPAAERMLGLPDGSLEHSLERFLSYIVPEDLPSFQQELASALAAAGGRMAAECRIERADGAVRWVHAHGTANRRPNRRVICYGIAMDVTERRRTERFYNNLFEQSPDAVFILDLEGNHVRANRRAAELLGYSPDESGRLSYRDTSTEPRENARVLERLLAGETIPPYERLFRRKDGTPVPVELHLSLLKGEGDEPRYIQSIARDITERRQRERQLEATVTVSAALRATTTRAEIVPIVLDQLLSLLHIEGAAIETRSPEGGPRVIELGRGIWEGATGSAIPAHTGLTEHGLTSGKLYVNNDVRSDPDLFPPHLFRDCRAVVGVRLPAQGGAIGLMWIGARRALDAHDQLVLITVADIAAGALQRSALFEETLSQREQILQIARSVPDGLALLDGSQRVLMINPPAQDYLAWLAGVGKGDLVTHLGERPLDDLLTSPLPGSWHEIVKDGRIFEIIARPLAEGPTPSGWAMVLRDVTQHREVQKKLQRQERLAAVGQLAAGIAHDFNNLMATVVLYARSLSRSPNLVAREQEQLDVIYEQAMHASNLVSQILDFSRRSVLARQPLDLLPFLKEQVKLLQRTLPENIVVALVADLEQAMVQADPTHIQQIVMNLAINARDAMPDGGSLTFELARVQIDRASRAPLPGMATGDWVHLAVRDTGTGIPPEVMGHLFEPYVTTKEPGKGTGLGLAQVDGIVGQHDGYIDVQTEAGRGTSFVIYLPAYSADRPSLPAAPDEVRVEGRGELILIVEDNKNLQAALVDCLEGCRYRTLAADNGEVALALLAAQEESPALVLSDMVMPRMGGVALFQALRRRGHTMPVIFLSGDSLDEAEVQPLRRQGLHAWLAKPSDQGELSRAIASALTAKGPPPTRT